MQCFQILMYLLDRRANGSDFVLFLVFFYMSNMSNFGVINFLMPGPRKPLSFQLTVHTMLVLLTGVNGNSVDFVQF